MTSYERYIKTEKGKAARRRALDNWNAKRRQARAAAKTSPEFRCPAVSSVFQLGSRLTA